jgi:hypothetical protein
MAWLMLGDGLLKVGMVGSSAIARLAVATPRRTPRGQVSLRPARLRIGRVPDHLALDRSVIGHRRTLSRDDRPDGVLPKGGWPAGPSWRSGH